MLSRFLNSNLFKRAVPVINRCLLNTCAEAPKRTFPKLEYCSSWIYRENYQINPLPPLSNQNIFPNVLTWDCPEAYPPKEISEEISNIRNEIKEPSSSTDFPKEAARLIVIRRKKMKKHKLRKLRKRMKFEWARLRQRREFKKEKEFQAVLIRQCKEADAFSAEKYVLEKLNKLHEVVIPRYWKGKRLPEFLIREKMGLPPK